MVYTQMFSQNLTAFNTMKISEVSKEVGITKDTIRLYKKMGLISDIPTPNPYNNYKEYSEEHVMTLKMIVVMKKLGFTLKECKTLLQSLKSKTLTFESQNEIINIKMKEIDQQILELTTLKETLKQFINFKCDKNL